jgi:hypothetical protein
MNNLFVPYEQSLHLKELGFNQECFGYYTLAEVRDYKNNGLDIRNEIVLNTLNGYRKYDDESQTSAPLYQQAFRWLREKYGIYPILDSSKGFEYVKWIYNVCSVKGGFNVGTSHGTYEETELACLKKLIEMVKGKEVSTQCNTFN